MSRYAKWLGIGQSPHAHWVLKSDGFPACRARLIGRRTHEPWPGMKRCPRCERIERDCAGNVPPDVPPMSPGRSRRTVAYRLPDDLLEWVKTAAAHRACSQQQVVEDAIEAARRRR